ncbi:hypothetical protein NDU88_001219 [Pleurodeles waltl]|uniref:Uncharacterized protein n=1 Tax=Pleurodeles waltl TaxID=8319 RepID=A0AAV7M4N8_PLEWA|nr:hypothetical protein NDU88_001219 [Pleurodeles waltl]
MGWQPRSRKSEQLTTRRPERRQWKRGSKLSTQPTQAHRELAAPTGTLSEQKKSIRGLERDCCPDQVNPNDQPFRDRRDGNGNGGTN